MEAPIVTPDPAGPRLRLLEGKGAALEHAHASLRAWILLFGSLCFAGGHGVFLFAALTRLQKLPSRAELGQGLELFVLGWFLLAAPLAFLGAGLRRRFLGLGGATAWSLASASLALTLFAFGYYLRAVALA